jgi:hypothetical protein
MVAFTFSLPESGVINMYQALLSGHTADYDDLKNAYPEFLKIMKFHSPDLHRSVIFLNRYLVSTIGDDEKLTLLSAALVAYLSGRGSTPETLQTWKKSHDTIQGFLDDDTMFNTEIVRESSIDTSLYTENLNADESKFSDIEAVDEIDDGTKSVFIDVAPVVPPPS